MAYSLLLRPSPKPERAATALGGGRLLGCNREHPAEAFATEDAATARLWIRPHPAVWEDLVQVEAVSGHDKGAAVVTSEESDR
jgi:hypothetical protein